MHRRLASSVALGLLMSAGVAVSQDMNQPGAYFRLVDPRHPEMTGRVVLPEFSAFANANLLDQVAAPPSRYLFSGLDRTLTAGEPGTTFRVCAGSVCGSDSQWTTGPAAVPAGAHVQMRVATGRTLGEVKTGTLSGGHGPITFQVTTRGQAPTMGSFVDRIDLERSTEVVSEPVRVEGYGSVQVVASGPGDPMLSLDGETWSNPLHLRSGQSVRVRATTGRDPGSARTVTVHVEDLVRDWSFSVKAANPNPVAFQFPTAERVTPGERVLSEPVSLAGMFGSASLLVEASPNASPLASINGGSFEPIPDTIPENATLRLSLLAPADADGSTAYARVSVGETQGVWNIATRDERPEAFAFTAAPFVVPGTEYRSGAVAIAGIDSPTEVSVSGDGSPSWRVAPDGSWSSGVGMLQPGEVVELRVTAADEEETSRIATLSVGGVTADLDVRTGRSRPDAFTIAAVNGVGDAVAISAPVALAGMTIEGSLVLPNGVVASINGAGFADLDRVPAGASVRFRAIVPSGSNGESQTHRISIGGRAADWILANLDTTPDAFEIVPLAGEDLGAIVASDPVEPTGFSSPAPIRVAGEGNPEVSVAGGPWVTSGTIAPGQSFRVRLQVANEGLTSREATVTIGGINANFSIVSAGADADPDAMVFSAASGVDPNGLVVSDAVLPVGFDAATFVAVSGPGTPEVSIAGRAYASSGRLRPGESLRLRAVSPQGYDASARVDVQVGATAASWGVSTRSYDATPDTLSFPAQNRVPGRTVTVSATVSPTGFHDDAALTVENGEVSVNGAAFASSATLRPGQAVRLRTTSPNPDGLTKTVTLRAGDAVIGTWGVTTIDTTMDVPWTQAELDTAFYNTVMSQTRNSPTRTVSGFDTGTPFLGGSCEASVGSTSGISPVLLVNGASRGVNHVVLPGDAVALRLGVNTVTSTLGSMGTCTWRFEGREFTARWRVIDAIPDPVGTQPIAFHAGVAPGAMVESDDYHTYGNQSPSLVSVPAGTQIRIAGQDVWHDGGEHRVPAQSTFRLRTAAPATGTKRVEVRQGERLQLRQYFEVTTSAVQASVAARVSGSLFDSNFESERVDTSVSLQTVSLPAGINVCVPFTIRDVNGGAGVFYAYVRNNLNTHWNYGVFATPSNGVNGWLRNHVICPGEQIRLDVSGLSVVGQPMRSVVTMGDYSQVVEVVLDGPNLDGDPNTFAFAAAQNATPNAVITSSIVTPTGYNAPTVLRVSGEGNPEFRVANGAWQSGEGTIRPGQALQVRATSGSAEGSNRPILVQVGKTVSTWTLATIDTMPDLVGFTGAIEVDPGAVLVSDEVVVAGLGQDVRVTASVAAPASLSVNGGALTRSAVAGNGDRLRLYVDAPAGYDVEVVHRLQVGAGGADWQVTTREKDDTPNPFVVPTQEGRGLAVLVTSEAVTPVGYLDAAPITVSGPEAMISINGAPFVTEGVIEPGDSFVIQMRTAGTPGTLAVATVTIGGLAVEWRAATAG